MGNRELESVAQETDDNKQVSHLLSQGYARHVAGRLDDAMACYILVLERRPEHAEALHLLAALLLQRGESQSALPLARQAVRLRSDRPAYLHTLGCALIASGAVDEALMRFESALRLDPKNLSTHLEMVRIYQRDGQSAMAIHHLEAIVGQDPARTSERELLGQLLLEASESARAEAVYLERSRLPNPPPGTYFNLGWIAFTEGRWDESERWFREVLSVDAAHPQAAYTLSQILLSAGRFREAWPLYEARWRCAALPREHPEASGWSGLSDPEQTLLVHSEQGLGDTLMHLRWLQMAKERVGRLILKVPARMKPWLLGLSFVDEVVTEGAEVDFDQVVPIASLPLALGVNSIDDLVPPTKDLQPSAERVARWKEWLDSLDGSGPRTQKIGLVWQGNADYKLDHLRSLHLEALEPLAGPGRRLIALQHGAALEQIETVPFAVIRPSEPFDSEGAFLDTAALMMALDEVVTTDTSCAHVLGQLGRSGHVLLGEPSEWRWGREGGETPWYPHLKLHRARAVGGPDSAVPSVAAHLAAAEDRIRAVAKD